MEDWICPVCRKSNAPSAIKCEQCSSRKLEASAWEPTTDITGKLEFNPDYALEASQEALREHMKELNRLHEAVCIFIREEFGNMNFESDEEVIEYVMSFLPQPPKENN